MVGKSVRRTRITQLAHAVYPSFAMLAGIQLDVFTPLAQGGKTVAELAEDIGVKPEKLLPLLYMLVAAELLTEENGLFSNSEESNQYLVRGSSQYIGQLEGFYTRLWRASLDTALSIKTASPQDKLDWDTQSDEQLEDYFSKQYVGCRTAGRELAKLVDLSRFTHLLDVAGGSGGISIEICERFEHLNSTIVELPRVAEIAKKFIEKSNLSSRIKVLSGDVTDIVPKGNYNLVVMRSFIQILSEKAAQSVINNVYDCMETGAALYIVGSILDNSHIAPLSALSYGMVFLNFYDCGQSYTETTYRKWLESAGFGKIEFKYELFQDGSSLIGCVKI